MRRTSARKSSAPCRGPSETIDTTVQATLSVVGYERLLEIKFSTTPVVAAWNAVRLA